ncbi:MAG: T9SS type A sorting domain-containing protein [Bacteroidia bacterium]|nr:T9SS type A sorting domain-containing protein [Bacteroidota bacterium]MBK8874259.1 T9SS type A sorting domain-containing protein [Bacteroidota bacterium]MBP9083232.1 T9SS type A sorting domain-containing protein [Bacteroidia bacterium]
MRALQIQLFLFLSFCSINVSNCQISFVNSYDSLYGSSMQQTADGGYILTGTVPINGGIADISLVKTDMYGSIEWAKYFSGDSSEWGDYVIQTSEKGFLLTGRTISFGHIKSDIYVIKTDSLGDTLWTRTFGGSDVDFSCFITESVDSNYFIVGSSSSFSAGTAIILIKINTNGDEIWTSVYKSSIINRISAESAALTNDKGLIIVGRAYQPGNNYYLLKTDSLGNLIWDKYYTSGITTYHVNRGYGVKQTSDGGYIMAGNYGVSPSSNGTSLFEIIKTDSSGNVLWDKAYGDSTTNTTDYAYSIDETFDGGFIAGGITSSFGVYQMYLVKTDNAGNLQWSKTFGASPSHIGVSFAVQAKDSSFVIAGHLGSPHPHLFNVFKTDKYGNTNCNMSVPPTNVYSMNSIANNANGYRSSIFGLMGNPSTQVINGSLQRFIACSNVGVSENFENELIRIFPNPSNSNFTIKLSKEVKNARIEIFNSLAEKIYSESFSGKSTTFSGNLRDGIYFVRVTDQQQSFVLKIIIKQ